MKKYTIVLVAAMALSANVFAAEDVAGSAAGNGTDDTKHCIINPQSQKCVAVVGSGGAAGNGVVARGLAIGASNVAGIGVVTAIAAAAIAAATSNNGTSTTVTATAG
jgi:hypothetical protein